MASFSQCNGIGIGKPIKKRSVAYSTCQLPIKIRGLVNKEIKGKIKDIKLPKNCECNLKPDMMILLKTDIIVSSESLKNIKFIRSIKLDMHGMCSFDGKVMRNFLTEFELKDIKNLITNESNIPITIIMEIQKDTLINCCYSME